MCDQRPQPLGLGSGRKKESCRDGSLGCAVCKNNLLKTIGGILKPIREKREELLGNKNIVTEILTEGSRKAGQAARETLREVLETIHFKKAPAGTIP